MPGFKYVTICLPSMLTQHFWSMNRTCAYVLKFVGSIFLPDQHRSMNGTCTVTPTWQFLLFKNDAQFDKNLLHCSFSELGRFQFLGIGCKSGVKTHVRFTLQYCLADKPHRHIIIIV